MLGVNHGAFIKTFKYFEDFEGNKKKNEKFIGYLRFIVYDGELSYLKKYFYPPIGAIHSARFIRRKLKMPIISIDNEKKMLRRLKSIAENRLSEYPETYDEDLKLLKNADLTFNQRNCIVFRMGEKKVVIFTIIDI